LRIGTRWEHYILVPAIRQCCPNSLSGYADVQLLVEDTSSGPNNVVSELSSELTACAGVPTRDKSISRSSTNPEMGYFVSQTLLNSRDKSRITFQGDVREVIFHISYILTARQNP
jgi:hypothetical protein